MKLAELLMEQRQWKEATAHLREIQKKFPKKIEIINRLGWSLLNSQEVDSAFQIWRRGLKLDPTNFEVRESMCKAHLMVGRGLRDKKLFINALVHFKKLAKLRPDDDTVHFELGLTYQQKGDSRSAYKEYKKAIKLNPKHKQARQNLSDLKIHR